MFDTLRRAFTGGRKSNDMGWDALVDYSLTTASEIQVSAERALRAAPVYRGVSIRCEVLGSLPIHLYRRRDDGGKDRATDHPLWPLLHDRPNPWTSASEFVMQLEKDCITHDNGAFALANRSGEKIVELIRLAPGSVTQEVDRDTLEPRYRVSMSGGGQRHYGWQDILHLPSPMGSPLKHCREAIGLCIAMERYAGNLFGRGARPSGILKVPGKLSDPRFEQLKKSWHAAHSGENSAKTAILEDGASFEPISFNSVDLQFQELRAFQVIETSRALGVPPTLIYDFGRATWGNAESMAQAFLTFTLRPRISLWSGAIMRLLSPEEQRQYVVEFLTDALVQADIAARFEAYGKAIASRIFNPNEIRAKENAAPYAGGNEFVNPNIQQAPQRQEPQRPRIAA